MRGHGEKVTGWLSAIQEAPWPETEGIVTLILDLPASKSVRNKLLLFTSHQEYGICDGSLSMSGHLLSTYPVARTLPGAADREREKQAAGTHYVSTRKLPWKK